MNRFGLNQSEYDLLLAADAAELRGDGDSVVAVLVRSDERMRLAASHLVSRTQDLDAAVASMAVTSGAMTLPRQAARMNAPRSPSPVRKLSWAARATILSGGLAAAALAAVVLYRDAPQPAARAVVKEEPLTATINASSSRPFAVIPTDNPDIAIVWLFNKEIN